MFGRMEVEIVISSQKPHKKDSSLQDSVQNESVQNESIDIDKNSKENLTKSLLTN